MEPKVQLFRNSWIALAASFAVVAVLALLPGRAGASIFNYGTVSSDVFYGQFKPTGSFLDQIQFSVASPFTVTLRDNFTDFSLVAGLNATLYNNPVGSALYTGTPNTPALGSSFVNLVPSTLLPAGAYELRISGTALGGGSTSYYSGYMTLASTTLPIPEPETYAMMLAGLGLMGFVARRRKQKEAAGA